jgi:hypothetical protein
MRLRTSLRRLHVWLAWIVGVPILFWTASGLWMVARPIDEVRGTALRAAPVSLRPPPVLVPPRGRALRSLALEIQAGRPVWIVGYPNGGAGRADPATGAMLPALTEPEARAVARAALARPPGVLAATRTGAHAPPIELRRARPAWAVTFEGGVRVYLDADSGAVLALRTEQWRWFDWMWGLHIMDLNGREATSHPVLIASAALALLATLVGLVLLPLGTRRR